MKLRTDVGKMKTYPNVPCTTKTAAQYVNLQAEAAVTIVSWQVTLYGAGSSNTGTIRLRFRNKTQSDPLVAGEASQSVSFSNGTQVTDSTGTIGYMKKSTASTAFNLPSGYGPEDMKVDFITTAADYTWTNIMYSV